MQIYRALFDQKQTGTIAQILLKTNAPEAVVRGFLEVVKQGKVNFDEKQFLLQSGVTLAKPNAI